MDAILLTDYTPALQNAEPFSVPYLSHFSRAGKDVYYIASMHSNADNTGCDPHTLNTIQTVMDAAKPSIYIIEGVPTALGLNPQIVSEQDKAEGFPNGREAAFTAYCAQQKGIAFIGGEADDRQVFQDMKQAGYSTADVMAYYVLRNVPALVKEGKTQEQIDKAIVQELSSNIGFQHISADERLSLGEFKAWYEQHNMSPPFSLYKLEVGHCAPYNGPDASEFQRMSYQTGRSRDKNLIGTIEEALKTHDKVMVVYGGGHLVTNRPVLEAAFGASENVKFDGSPENNPKADKWVAQETVRTELKEMGVKTMDNNIATAQLGNGTIPPALKSDATNVEIIKR